MIAVIAMVAAVLGAERLKKGKRPKYDYDCRLDPNYDFDTWTIRPRAAVGAAPAVGAESSADAAGRLGVREQTLRAKARALGHALAQGPKGAAATLTPAQWDAAGALLRHERRPGPRPGYREKFYGGRETCPTAARRLGVHRDVLRRVAVRLGYDTSTGLQPEAWDTVAAKVRHHARRAA